MSAKQSGHQIEIEFSDSAPAVPAKSLPYIFERLYRVDESRNRRFGGSGLGLAICEGIVQAHGGTITASTSQLGGLRIGIMLPVPESMGDRHEPS